jgi:hypothetical protein
MGSVGAMPALQVGGVQEAITVPCPASDALAVPMLPNTEPVETPEAPTDTGFEVLQVSGTPVTSWLAISVTVAFNIVEVPLFTRNQVIDGSLAGAAALEMLFTWQLSTELGWPTNGPADA